MAMWLRGYVAMWISNPNYLIFRGNLINPNFRGFPKMKFKSCQSNLEQNDSTELSGSSFLNIYITKQIENGGKTSEIHIIGTACKSKQLGNFGFCTSTLKSFILLAHSLHLSLRFYIPG